MDELLINRKPQLNFITSRGSAPIRNSGKSDRCLCMHCFVRAFTLLMHDLLAAAEIQIKSPEDEHAERPADLEQFKG